MYTLSPQKIVTSITQVIHIVIHNLQGLYILKGLLNEVLSLENPFLGFELWTSEKGPHNLNISTM